MFLAVSRGVGIEDMEAVDQDGVSSRVKRIYIYICRGCLCGRKVNPSLGYADFKAIQEFLQDFKACNIEIPSSRAPTAVPFKQC